MDPVSNEIHNSLTQNKSHDHLTQNELIHLLVKEVKKENLQQLNTVKYFTMILNCMLEFFHQEELIVILGQFDPGKEAVVH